MHKSIKNKHQRTPSSIIDTLLYLMAGSAMAIISVSFVLWLNF